MVRVGKVNRGKSQTMVSGTKGRWFNPRVALQKKINRLPQFKVAYFFIRATL